MVLWTHYGASVGAVVSAALGGLVFANAYFVNNGVVWQILDPLRMLTALAWAAGASQANVATPEGSRLRSDGSQGYAGTELPAVGRMDHRQHGLLRI